MTAQLSKAQIDAIKVELAKVGLSVTVKKIKAAANDPWLARVKAWKPETPAGRACKSNMLWLASLPPIQGIKRVEHCWHCTSNNPSEIAAWYADTPEAYTRRQTPTRLLLAGPDIYGPVKHARSRVFGRAGLVTYLHDKINHYHMPEHVDGGWSNKSYMQLAPEIRYAIANS